MATLEGIPADIVDVELAQGSVALKADATTYPLDALYGAAYVFIDRCYVFIDRPDAANFRVVLSVKKPGADEATLKSLVGEFANELLSCAWRHQITQENRALIEAVTTTALAGAMGPPSLDELASFDFTEENFEDPLGIAMSWEEKYKKKDKPAESSAANASGEKTAGDATAGVAATGGEKTP